MLLLVIVSMLSVACTPTLTTWEAPAAEYPPELKTYVLETTCEHCDRRKLDSTVAAVLGSVLPHAHRVFEPAAASIVIRYSEGDSVICLDCDGKSLLRSWWWLAEIYAPPFTNREWLLTTLSGGVDKFRGRPAPFFGQQFKSYAVKRGWLPNSSLQRTSPAALPRRESGKVSRRAKPLSSKTLGGEIYVDHEDAFKDFVSREKQERYAQGLRSPKSRKKLLDRLNHNHDFDPSSLLRLAKEKQSESAVYALLKSGGAPHDCYVFSANASIDGLRMPLAEALSKTFAMGHGTVISCIPGKLATSRAKIPGSGTSFVDRKMAAA